MDTTKINRIWFQIKGGLCKSVKNNDTVAKTIFLKLNLVKKMKLRNYCIITLESGNVCVLHSALSFLHT